MKSAYIPVPLYIINMGELGITIYCREIERLITTAYNTLVKSPKQDKSLANNQIVSLQQIKQIYEDNTATHKVNIANQMLYINDVKPFKFQIFKILSPRFKNDDSVICFQFIPFKLNTESQIVFNKIMTEQLYFFLAYIGLEISRCRETNSVNNLTELQAYLESSRDFLIKQLSFSLAKVWSV